MPHQKDFWLLLFVKKCLDFSNFSHVVGILKGSMPTHLFGLDACLEIMFLVLATVTWNHYYHQAKLNKKKKKKIILAQQGLSFCLQNGNKLKHTNKKHRSKKIQFQYVPFSGSHSQLASGNQGTSTTVLQDVLLSWVFACLHTKYEGLPYCKGGYTSEHLFGPSPFPCFLQFRENSNILYGSFEQPELFRWMQMKFVYTCLKLNSLSYAVILWHTDFQT